MQLQNLKEHRIFQEEGVTKQLVFDTSHVLCFVLNLRTEQTLPQHKHPHSTLVVTLLSGLCNAEVNGRIFPFSKDHALLVDGNDDFGIPGVQEDVSLFVSLFPNPNTADEL